MTADDKLKLMAEIKSKITDYLQEELKINSDALKSYDDRDTTVLNGDAEIKKMREIEAIKLRDRIHELNRYIAVIKRM